MDMYKRIENKISNVFGEYGKAVSRNPVSAIGFAVILNCLLGINIKWISSENDMKTLYTPTNSQADLDENKIKSMFPEKSHENYYYHQLADLGHYGSVIFTVNDNIISRPYKEEIQSFHDMVMNISVNSSEGKMYFYKDLCAVKDGKCSIGGSWYFEDYFWKQMKAGKVKYPTSSSGPNGVHRTDLEFGLANVENGKLISARSLHLRYFLRQHTNEYTELSIAWEKKFTSTMTKFKANLTDFAVGHSNSLNTELDENTDGDVALFSISFTILITYASFVTAGGNCLTQRGHLGRLGVIATGLAILGSFGLCSALQVKFVNMVGIMPFMILGIGVDDVFILLSGLTDAPLKASVDARISHTMQTTGVAITITSLTDLIAFILGYMSDFMSVRNFCVYSGIAVILCYINQVTFFLGCLVLHERRIAASRHCFTCKTVYTADDMKSAGFKHPLKLACCSGQPARRREDHQSALEKIPTKILPKLVLNFPAMVVIVLTYIGFLAFSVWGAIHLEQGLQIRDLFSEDSYYYKYSILEHDNFPLPIPISFNVEGTLDYSDPQVVSQIHSLMETAKSSPIVQTNFEINWLKKFYDKFDKAFGEIMDNTTEFGFCDKVRLFLQFAPIFQNDVVFDTNGSKIIHSRFYIMTNSIKRSYDQGQMMLRMREIADKSSLPVFAYGQPFVFFEQYVSVLPNTMQTVGIAIVACFLVTCIFMPHPLLIVLVTLSVISIMTGVFGFMYWWGLSISCITMIHVIMCVGFSVDFSAHVCHAYMTVSGTDRKSLVYNALVRAGGPVFNCAASSIFGICTLIFSKSFVFRSFFKIMCLVISFAFFHSVFVLPTILSLVGPLAKGLGTNRKTSSQVQLSPRRPSATWSISGGVNALDFGGKNEFLNKEMTH